MNVGHNKRAPLLSLGHYRKEVYVSIHCLYYNKWTKVRERECVRQDMDTSLAVRVDHNDHTQHGTQVHNSGKRRMMKLNKVTIDVSIVMTVAIAIALPPSPISTSNNEKKRKCLARYFNWIEPERLKPIGVCLCTKWNSKPALNTLRKRGRTRIVLSDPMMCHILSFHVIFYAKVNLILYIKYIHTHESRIWTQIFELSSCLRSY